MTPQEKLAKLQVGAKLSFTNIPDFISEVVGTEAGENGEVTIYVTHGSEIPTYFTTGLEIDTSKPNTMALDNLEIVEEAPAE